MTDGMWYEGEKKRERKMVIKKIRGGNGNAEMMDVRNV